MVSESSPVALGAILAPAALVAVPAGLTFDLAGATPPPRFPIPVAPLSAAAPPFAISVGDGAVVVVAALFGRAVGVVVAMSPFLPSPAATPLLLGGAPTAAPASAVVVVAVALAAVAPVAPPPLLAIVVPAAAAVVGVVPSTSPALPALPVPLAVAVVPPGGVAVEPSPLAGRSPLLLSVATRLHHQGAVQVGLHVRVEV